jgi:hypothetical protein
MVLAPMKVENFPHIGSKLRFAKLRPVKEPAEAGNGNSMPCSPLGFNLIVIVFLPVYNAKA